MSSQRPWSPTSDCARLAAFHAGGEKGDGGGLRGGLIGTVLGSIKAGINGD
jgi:hypothetical protein